MTVGQCVQKLIRTALERLLICKNSPEIRVLSSRQITKADLVKVEHISPDNLHELTEIEVDSFKLKMLSNYLYQMHEPVLNNYYLNKTIYRFTLVPGVYGLPFVASVIKDGDSAFISLKMPENAIELPSRHIFRKKNGEDSIIPFVAKPVHFAINEYYKTEMRIFDTLQRLMNDSSITSMPGISNAIPEYTDAAGYFLEAHTSKGYMCVFRWGFDHNPTFEKIVHYFFKITDIHRKEQEFYRVKYHLY